MSRKLRSFKSDQTSSKSGDLLSNYDRLLTIYIDELRKAPVNPYQSLPTLAAKLFWPPFLNRVIEMTRRLILVPNVLKIDFIGSDSLLRELENLENQTLRAVSECNQVNRRRMLRRSVMGFAPQIAAVLLRLA